MEEKMSYILQAKQGNLLEEPNATFIVNASNTKMMLGSGVSMAFKRHCGVMLQTLMLHELQKKVGPLEQGDVLCTRAAEATNFEFALHAAVMNYNSGVSSKDQNPTLQTIQKSLWNIEHFVQSYIQHHETEATLVLPLMGCGVGGLEKESVIKTYIDFFSREVPFACHVVVYRYSQGDYRLIEKLFDNTHTHQAHER